jgi:hypothetical protein
MTCQEKILFLVLLLVNFIGIAAISFKNNGGNYDI